MRERLITSQLGAHTIVGTILKAFGFQIDREPLLDTSVDVTDIMLHPLRIRRETASRSSADKCLKESSLEMRRSPSVLKKAVDHLIVL